MARTLAALILKANWMTVSCGMLSGGVESEVMIDDPLVYMNGWPRVAITSLSKKVVTCRHIRTSADDRCFKLGISGIHEFNSNKYKWLHGAICRMKGDLNSKSGMSWQGPIIEMQICLAPITVSWPGAPVSACVRCAMYFLWDLQTHRNTSEQTYTVPNCGAGSPVAMSSLSTRVSQ
jgi:hypothetical protein